MSRTVTIAEEVAGQLGDEQVARLRGPQWARRVQCWECAEWLAADEDAAVLLLRVADPENTGTGAGASFVLHVHPSCRSSQVLELTRDQIAARAAAAPTHRDDDPGQVDVVATVFDTGRGSAFPVVMLSYRADLIADRPGADRVDLLAGELLRIGWHPIRSLDEPPAAGPAGYRLRFRHDEPHAAAPGVLEVLDPHGRVETVATVDPARLWRPAVVRTGRCALIQGSQYLTDWAARGRAGVKRAVRAGLLVGGSVPVHLHGPGNAVRGSVYR
ncbi:hypothetical protein [Saccharothrix obliqua]|uniref:hypothetical protein n=1 Tax=Saccharothrix obliqua TaxID=2861747 RepID=UPI001C5EE633|nr:hypothetical protein [Saccharothrix obliqua]MBW4722398.1 hypothetical protein [Saccharothrix obliqua]